ncbi:MAG: caspase family protein [Pseudonocardiaceae bacterium]
MNQPRFPDPTRSGALLIGTGHFPVAGPDLPAIPAVQANLTDLRQVLTSPDSGVLRPEFCRVLADPVSVDEVGSALADMAAMATDLLLVYYAGHGLVDDRGRLHLALARTHPRNARWTALPVDLLREEIATSPAAVRVLVLDCCFSGRAIEAMSDNQGVITGQLDVAGTYTLTSTTANAPSHAPVGDRYTAFTGALLRALGHADPLTLDQIYAAVDRDLAARNLPRPQRHAVNAAGDLALSRGPTPVPPTEQLDSGSVRLGFAPEQPIPFGWPGLITTGCIGILFFSVIAINYSESWDELWYMKLLIGISVFIPLMIFGAMIGKWVEGWREPRPNELTLDRSGLTVQRNRKRYHFPWQAIAQVGTLQPVSKSLTAVYGNSVRAVENILVIRLRSDFPPPPQYFNVLSHEHRQLGYVGLRLREFGASREEMTSALERFAGSKLAYSPRQFLDRDSRLRPDMM